MIRRVMNTQRESRTEPRRDSAFPDRSTQGNYLLLNFTTSVVIPSTYPFIFAINHSISPRLIDGVRT